MGGIWCKPNPLSANNHRIVSELSLIIDQTIHKCGGMSQIYDDLRLELLRHKTISSFYRRFSGTKLWVDNMLQYNNTRNYIQDLLILTLDPKRFKATQTIYNVADINLWFHANKDVDAIGDRDVIWAAILCNFILGQECNNNGVVCVVPKTKRSNIFSPFSLFKPCVY